MKFLFTLLVISFLGYAQNKVASPSSFKGEHYAFYSKCFLPITFCEVTQQTYTSCGSIKNCYGLYVMPGDTFYVNIEDKNQQEVISADISFGGYLPAISNVIFKPIDNNCIPQQALQIAIPLTAVPGSSFQIISQNIAYVNSPLLQPGLPNPYNIYVAGQQPQFTFALSDFTVCPIIEHVSVREINSKIKSHVLYPNPSNGRVSISNFAITDFNLEVYNLIGNLVFSDTSKQDSFDLTSLENGLYVCKLIKNNKVVASEKLILFN
jgi:hypothetical protein